MTSLAPTAPPATRPARSIIWAWPLAILVGFPIGGLIAHTIVGQADSVATTLAGGLLAGIVIGTAQWLALRPLAPGIWPVATSLGMAVGLAAGAALVDYGSNRSDVIVIGAVTGLAVGGVQAILLARRHVRRSAWWAAAGPPTWALGWLVTSYVITTNVEEQFTNFGASGALLYALLTGLVLLRLLPRFGPRDRADA